MENNGLSNENDVVFRDVILLALTGFISMVILLIPFVNPPTEEESSSTPPGNVIVELFWDDKRDVDIDLWVQAPDDIPVGYSNKGGIFLYNLLTLDIPPPRIITSGSKTPIITDISLAILSS